MPRKHDLLLEKRLVKAAQTLCAREGQDAVTMRHVALLAKTSTPTLYQRFASREAILRALREVVRKSLAREMRRATSPEDACLRYLNFAVKRPHEYELLMSGGWKDSEARGYRGLVFEAAQKMLAQKLGGNPEAFAGLILELWCLVHGGASLLIAGQKEGTRTEDVREACLSAYTALLRSGTRQIATGEDAPGQPLP